MATQRGRLMKLSEISEKTGVPIETLRHLRKRGRAPWLGVVAGRVVAYEQDVDDWVAAELAASRKESLVA